VPKHPVQGVQEALWAPKQPAEGALQVPVQRAPWAPVQRVLQAPEQGAAWAGRSLAEAQQPWEYLQIEEGLIGNHH